MTPNEIITQVARLYDVPVKELMSRKRHRVYADCRTVICYTLCEVCGLSTLKVGRIINRSHSLVLYHIGKANDWKRMPILNDDGYKAIIDMEQTILREIA